MGEPRLAATEILKGASNPAIPFSSRDLSPSEETRLDVYYYISPKNENRLVSLVEPCRLALALELEFDSDVTSFLPRPRTLLVEGREVELCFWLRRQNAAESFVIFRRQTKPSVSAVRAEERFCSRLLESACRAGIALTIRKPSSLLTARVANATRLELLPYVQSTTGRAGIDVLLAAILAHMGSHPVSSFHAIEKSLCGPFDWRDVRSATCLLIHRGVLYIDFNERLKVTSTVSLKGAGDA